MEHHSGNRGNHQVVTVYVGQVVGVLTAGKTALIRIGTCEAHPLNQAGLNPEASAYSNNYSMADASN